MRDTATEEPILDMAVMRMDDSTFNPAGDGRQVSSGMHTLGNHDPLRRWFLFWNDTVAGRAVAPVACALFTTMNLTRLFFGIDQWNLVLVSASFNGNTVLAKVVVLTCCIASLAALPLRHRHPFTVFLWEAVVSLLMAAMHADQYVVLPMWCAVYAAVNLLSQPLASISVALVVVVAFARSALLRASGSDWSSLLPYTAMMLAVVVVALISRTIKQGYRSDEALRAEHLRAERAAHDRDRAEVRSRIAAELHDSVGHDLTAIIALSEGLKGVSDDETVVAAIDSINDLARAGLEDTRTAVRSLTGNGAVDVGCAPIDGRVADHGFDFITDGDVNEVATRVATSGEDGGFAAIEKRPVRVHDSNGESNAGKAFMGASTDTGVVEVPGPHAWDDIREILSHVERTGVAAVFSETGRRSRDERQADLCFRVTREAVTNVLRHAGDATRVTVQWDHRPDGGMRLAVRDDGTQEGGSVADGIVADGRRGVVHDNSDPTGLGLARLRREVQESGGSMNYGPMAAGGWMVMAELPEVDND
jgi:two-component system, NarL family, sensor histidine kinase UhpB